MTGREDIFQKAMNEGHSAAWDQMWEQAVSAYQKALDEFPENPKALTSLGLALFQLSRFEEALEIYLQAARASPEDPVPLEKVAQLSERLGNLEQAIQAAIQAAELYIKNQEIEKAIENWLRVTQLDPENLGAHSRLAMVHEHLGHKQQAVIEYLAIASLLQHAGNMDKATETIGRALKLKPDSAEAKQAQSLLKSGQRLPKPVRPKGGTGPLRMAQVRKLESPKPTESGLDPIGEARQKALKRLAEALFEYTDNNEESQSSRRGLQEIVRGTGPLRIKKGEHSKILLHLGQAIDAQTHDQEAQAAEELDKALAAGFNHPALYFDLGFLHTKGKRLESALRYLQHAVKHADYALGARLLMGQLLRRMDRLPEAVSEYMEAIKLADTTLLPAEQADEIRQMYEPIVEAQSRQSDKDSLNKLCDNIEELLLQPSWRANITQAREQLPKGADGTPPTPLVEIMTQVQGSEVIDAINKVHQLARSGYLRTATEEAFHALKHAPTYLPLHSLIGELLIKEGRTQEAIAKFTAVAQVYNIRGESEQATNMFRRIIQLAPMDLTARTHLIEQLAVRGQIDEAIGEYMDLADIYYRLAELDMARNTYTTALRLAQQTSDNRKWSVQILQHMADIDVQRLDWRQAIRVFEQIRTLRPDDVATRKNLVELNIRLGQKTQASAELDSFIAYLESNRRRKDNIPFLENLVGEHPEETVLRRYLAEEYRQADRISEAIAQLDTLGENLLEAGDNEGAMEAIRAIITMDPPNVEDYRKLLAQIQAK